MNIFQKNQVEAEAKQIAEDANRLLQNHNQLLADMQNRRIQLEDLLNRAQTQQETVWQLRNSISIFRLINMRSRIK